jgi:hypothetical protein
MRRVFNDMCITIAEVYRYFGNNELRNEYLAAVVGRVVEIIFIYIRLSHVLDY